MDNEICGPLPRITIHSNVGIDGTEYIVATVENPILDGRDYLHGGKCVHFDIDNRKQQTTASLFHWRHGVACFDRELRCWKGEVLTEGECLSVCKSGELKL